MEGCVHWWVCGESTFEDVRVTSAVLRTPATCRKCSSTREFRSVVHGWTHDLRASEGLA